MLHDLDRRHSSPTRGNELSDHPYIFRKFFSGLNACQRIVGFWDHKSLFWCGTGYLMPGMRLSGIAALLSNACPGSKQLSHSPLIRC